MRGAAALLALAVYAPQVVQGFSLTWNTGGSGIRYLGHHWFVVAIEPWKAHLRLVPAMTATA
jgi:hypothetical protein